MKANGKIALIGAAGAATLLWLMKKNKSVSGIGEAPFKFREGDRVLVHGREGDFEGVVENYDYNMMSWKKEYSIEYNGGRTMMGVPESAIELIERAPDEEYRRRMAFNRAIWMYS